MHSKGNRPSPSAQTDSLANLSEERIARIGRQTTLKTYSLDTPAIPDDDSSESWGGGFFPAPNAADDIIDNTHTYQLRNLFTQAMIELLKPREEYILRLRLGLHPNQEMTLGEVSEKLGISRQRIQQIEANALLRLRNSPRLAGARAGLQP